MDEIGRRFDLYCKTIAELQELWEANRDILSEQHELTLGIRSSQIAALVMFLIEKRIIK